MDDDMKFIWKPGPHHDATNPGGLQCRALFQQTLNYVKRLERRDHDQRLSNRITPKPQDTPGS